MQRYTINQIRSELESKRGEKFTDEQFDNLLSSFATYAGNRGMYDRSAIYHAIRRGWMSVLMAAVFKHYATQ